MRRGLPLLVATLFTTGSALAHDTGTTHQETPSVVPPTVFLAGVLVLGTAVLLDARDALPGRQADAGVAVGALGIVAGIALLFL